MLFFTNGTQLTSRFNQLKGIILDTINDQIDNVQEQISSSIQNNQPLAEVKQPVSQPAPEDQKAYGDGTKFQVIFSTVGKDGKQIDGNEIIDGFKSPVNFCDAYKAARILLHNKYPYTGNITIHEIATKK